MMARAPEGFVEEWYFLRAVLVAAFQSRHGRLPKPRDRDPGAWLSSQRSAANRGLASMTPERIFLLDRVVPGWREYLPQPDTWPSRVDELVAFRTIQNRWPSQKAEDAPERSLGIWLSNQRQLARRNELVTRKRLVLDQEAPGWYAGSRDEAWHRSADALGGFHRRHGRWPSKAAKDSRERKLGTWLHNRRQDSRTGAGWTTERAEYLERAAPGWNG